MDLSQIPSIKHLSEDNFFLLAGPCAIEGEEMALRIAEKVINVTDKLKIPYVFKGSFKKANRSRIDSFTGIGDEKALKILAKVSKEFDVPTVTDIHTEQDADIAAAYVDILQIPAFLVRQTDLVAAAAKTGKTVNLKKGQFMSPEAMQHAVQKVHDSGNNNAMITDRGTMFGYQDMVVEVFITNEPGRSVRIEAQENILNVIKVEVKGNTLTIWEDGCIQNFKQPKIYISTLFLETHHDPKIAKSDGANMLKLDYLEDLLTKLVAIRHTINQL